jgi:hypothetical protein
LAIEELMRCNLVFYALFIVALRFKNFRYKVAQIFKGKWLSEEILGKKYRRDFSLL